MMECYVHKNATKKNVKYLAHLIKRQTGHLFEISDDGKKTFLMNVHAHDNEDKIVAKFPKRKPFTILLRYRSHQKHTFMGGSMWHSPEFVEHMHAGL